MDALTDKVVIVTGASSGIGASAAMELGKAGAHVVCAARRKNRLDALVKGIVKEGGSALAVECDVTDRSQVQTMAESARRTFGPIDCLINNAGVMPLSFMDACKVDEWTRMVDVNLTGVLLCVGAVLPEMIERAAGHIINISSIAGRKVFPGGAVYCATKHAVHALSEGLRQELAPKGVRVTCIAPGLVTTELQNAITDERVLERFKNLPADFVSLEAHDIARAILYAMEAPIHVSINEILVRPARQEG